MFLKSVVEFHLFLKGSELSKDKNAESPSFKHFRPETTVGEFLKVLQFYFTNKLVPENNLQNYSNEIFANTCIFAQEIYSRSRKVWIFRNF